MIVSFSHKHFAQESLNKLNGQGNLVLFTHGLRTFTDIDSNNMYEPVNNMYLQAFHSDMNMQAFHPDMNMQAFHSDVKFEDLRD